MAMRGPAVFVLALFAARAHAQPAPHAGVDVPRPGERAADLGAPALADDDFGPVLTIEAIEIHGNNSTRDAIIRRALPIAPGDVLRASDKRLSSARFRVLALGYFRDVALAMKKGTQRGNVIVEINVVERGTIVLNRLWFGHTGVAPFWVGTDVGERNLFGLGISVGAGLIYAAKGEIEGSRAQFAGEIRVADGSIRGSRWGAGGSLTLVHGSDFYRTQGAGNDTSETNYRAFSYDRIGGRIGTTYDLTTLARLFGGLRYEGIKADVPFVPTRTLPDGRVVPVDLHLEPGESRVITIAAGFDRDTRPDPILPHSGGQLTAAVELGTSVLLSDYDFANIFARYEHWWPLREERHTIGVRLAGGIVIGNAPRFDRIHISDVDRMLTPRALGLVLSNSAPIDFLTTRDDKPMYGDLGASATVEYAIRLFRGIGPKSVYGGDVFFGAGVWGLAELTDYQYRATTLWNALPIDLYLDAGVRIDTDIGIFELTVANALGRIR